MAVPERPTPMPTPALAASPARFARAPRTAKGHFALCLYAAIFRLLAHVHRVGRLSGREFSDLVDRYPFLGGYLAEIRREMPEEITWIEGCAWWWDEVTRWQSDATAGDRVRLPLGDLTVEGGLSWDGLLAFMLVGLVEEDSRFGTLFAELQEPLAHRRPTLELVGQVMSDSGDPVGSGAWELCRPLIETGLVETVDRRAPRAEWVLRVPPVLWDAARGLRQDLSPDWCAVHGDADFPRLDELVCPPDFMTRLARVPALVATPRHGTEDGRARTVVLRASPGADPLELAGALARTLGRGVVAVEREHSEAEEVRTLLAPLATLCRAVPFLSYDLTPGETAAPPPLDGYRGVVFVALGLEGGLSEETGERSLTLEVPAPDRSLRRRQWRRALGDAESADLDAIADRFHLGSGYIRRAATIARGRAALAGRQDVELADVREATRTLSRQLLDNLATLLDADGSWSQLVCGQATGAKLAELERRCRHRERLLARLGRGFKRNANRGVRALFAGASGTGKTYAARILAAELGMDLYRVDLASVINKYIGETEKNLHRVLSRAEALDVLLLLDEGDALLSTRTEVRSSNDRYANLETNYLLQRLENYEGVVVVTTNLGENIDSAFQRRMDVVVPFLLPTAEERWRILDLHLPDDHQIPVEVLDRVASACHLSGGQLRNAGLHASLLALDEGDGPVAARHLETAVASEYRKAGAAYPLNDHRLAPAHGGVESFITALTESR